ncbi:tyrosine--tRNA ligase [Candidatus Parcubacteria bacterium]|nr:tyrosine--tRNA ligase [Patescibacteria group bacterium]MBU4380900.1 tyrosine--tRNA ligase [Patescibacteria group bacterium]MCG2688951.1 tyrosine--tRNA ligase [Candidatus Parcubacteria bacterium]
MTPQEKVEIIKSFAQEIVSEDELLKLFEEKEHPVAYDGFEPSGIAPIHFGLLRAINVKRLLSCDIHLKLYLADYFAYINNKIGGDLEKIKRVGEYFVEIWKASGVDTTKIEIVWASELMDSIDYWDRVLTVAKSLTLQRTLKSLTIAGRSEKDTLSTAQLFYPSMQVADIFEMEIDICQLGMDQRRANMIAREVAEKQNWKKPIAVHHPMLLGLKGVKELDNPEATMIASKMSKSDPTSAIYMHDAKEKIEAKIRTAFCPPNQTLGNPIFEYAKLIVIPVMGNLKVYREPKHGGYVEYFSSRELQIDYENGNLHPNDLKSAVASSLDFLIKPVRSHFEKDRKAKKLYNEVRSYQITR